MKTSEVVMLQNFVYFIFTSSYLISIFLGMFCNTHYMSIRQYRGMINIERHICVMGVETSPFLLMGVHKQKSLAAHCA